MTTIEHMEHALNHLRAAQSTAHKEYKYSGLKDWLKDIAAQLETEIKIRR